MKLEVRSTIEEPVEQIAARAGRMPDNVERLRYLRGLVILAPVSWWGRTPRPTLEAAATGTAALFIGAAILIWILR